MIDCSRLRSDCREWIVEHDTGEVAGGPGSDRFTTVPDWVGTSSTGAEGTTSCQRRNHGVCRQVTSPSLWPSSGPLNDEPEVCLISNGTHDVRVGDTVTD